MVRSVPDGGNCKKNVNPEVMLEDPKPVLEEPEPRPETPREGESAAATAAREARDRLLKDRVAAENEERRERGPKVGSQYLLQRSSKEISIQTISCVWDGRNETFCSKKSTCGDFLIAI